MKFRVIIEAFDENGTVKSIKVSSEWHEHMKKSYKEAAYVINKYITDNRNEGDVIN